MARVIMIQGTMSNAGKSLLAAGLCRIFKQDGYKAAPFKAQNMALNSYITRDGLEMGRAQVVQAQAAGAEPSVNMNPVLLKPSNDTGSQVIVNGIPIGNMDARDYFKYKKELMPVVMNAFETLQRDYDIIVIEGAGSPAEINLKQDDIVNMGMARMAKAPVLLAGDIDRGGVFAQLYGTVELLEKDERDMVKGLIINKFRGDKTILDPGVDMIEKLCKIPVLGVVPYMNVDIEDEDSLSSRLSEQPEKKAVVDIAVLRFPRLSNFTDFNVFSRFECVSVRYVTDVKMLREPDLIILPGTKNTVEDLLWMRQNGLEAAVLKLAAGDIPVFGICGGYQMMGRELLDPYGTESGVAGKTVRGMGLFPYSTRFEAEKTRTRVTGSFGNVEGIFKRLSGLNAEGYEIHMGKMIPAAGESGNDGLILFDESRGALASQDGMSCNNLYGTYVHGIFDRGKIAETVIKALLAGKGYDESLANSGGLDYFSYREEQFDKLAAGLRSSLDMKAIYEIMEYGI